MIAVKKIPNCLSKQTDYVMLYTTYNNISLYAHITWYFSIEFFESNVDDNEMRICYSQNAKPTFQSFAVDVFLF